MRARPFISFVSALGIVVAGNLATRVASAGTGPKLALDGEFAFGLQPDRLSNGAGGALRLGFELDAVVLSLTPEVGASYHGFAGDVDTTTAFRAFGGARLAFFAVVRPGIYAHAGYAHVGFGNASSDAATYDGGLFLDFTLLPVLDLGLHGGYTMVAGSTDGPAVHWANVGAHIAFTF